MADDVQLGRMIQGLRLSLNLTQEEVAERVGVSRGTVSRLERGIVNGATVGALRDQQCVVDAFDRDARLAGARAGAAA